MARKLTRLDMHKLIGVKLHVYQLNAHDFVNKKEKNTHTNTRSQAYTLKLYKLNCVFIYQLTGRQEYFQIVT